jgi:hypothetical protein
MRILRPDQIQPADDPARVLGEAAEGPVARLFAHALDVLGATIHPPALESAIRESRFDQLWRHLALERLGSALRPTLNRLAVVHDRAAIDASMRIASAPISKARPSRLVTPAVIHLTYDPLNAATVAAQNVTNDAIAAHVEDTAQATAEEILSRGLSSGARPAVIARALRDTLGLSVAEANAVESYRAALDRGARSPLIRALRDRRYDAMIDRGRLSPEQIERIVARYAARYRAFRANRLARTEGLRAANQGRAAAWAQYAALTGEGYRRFWLIAGDELVCPICAAIPDMNPEGVAPDEPYQTPIGDLMRPPDPHPQCRCSERFERIIGSNPAYLTQNTGIGLRVELDYGQGE